MFPCIKPGSDATARAPCSRPGTRFGREPGNGNTICLCSPCSPHHSEPEWSNNFHKKKVERSLKSQRSAAMFGKLIFDRSVAPPPPPQRRADGARCCSSLSGSCASGARAAAAAASCMCAGFLGRGVPAARGSAAAAADRCPAVNRWATSRFRPTSPCAITWTRPSRATVRPRPQHGPGRLSVRPRNCPRAPSAPRAPAPDGTDVKRARAARADASSYSFARRNDNAGKWQGIPPNKPPPAWAM